MTRSQKEIPIMTVSAVNRLANELLSNLYVRVIGELDERFDMSRGYGLGRLSDPEASIELFIPSRVVSEQKDYLQAGQKIVAEGRLGIYEPFGKFSLTVTHIEPHGEGVLQQELEKLKLKLAALGYFAEERKRALPAYPERIGVITARKSAAWSDFKKHVVREYAGLTIYLHDALMQGAYCIDSVCSAFARLAKDKLDLIVVTRGGGSLQDLMPFNSQEIVEAIIGSPYPVVTAIGHEIDITLADLAADLYVSTPTKAAEIIAEKYAILKKKLTYHLHNLQRVKLYYKNLPIVLENEKRRLNQSMVLLLKDNRKALSEAHEQLELLSPRGTLKRGYSVTFNKGGKIVKSANKLRKEDSVKTMLFKGEFTSVIQEISN